MSFTYKPIVDEALAQEAREFPLLQDGKYRLKVISSKFKVSQNGNPLIELTLLTRFEGKEYRVFDSLIGTPNMEWKTKHFCESAGLFEEYRDERFNEQMAENKYVMAHIIKVGARPNPNKPGEMYKARNEVKDYIVEGSNSSNSFMANQKNTESVADIFNDDLPF